MWRIPLPEIEDAAWYPDFLRTAQTDYLRWLMDTFDPYHAALPLFADFVRRTENRHLLDLCSGGGGALPLLYQQMHDLGDVRPFSALMSDLYPNASAGNSISKATDGDIDYLAKPLRAVDFQKITLENKIEALTLFNGAHHMPPHELEELFGNVVDSKLPIAVFEPMDKSIPSLLVNILSTSILMFLVAPFVRPFSLSRLFFTYLIPLVPLFTCWDGIASWFRLYNKEHLLKIAKQADSHDRFHWQSGIAAHTFGKVTYLIGTPKA